MIVKTAVSFLTTNSDPQLLVDTDAILASVTGNAAFPTPTPPLTDVKLARDTFSAALGAASGGGKTLTSSKNDRRAELVALLRELASYVHIASAGNMIVLLNSNFPTQKPTRQSVGPLPAPAGVTVTSGSLSGELDTRFSPVPGAALYNWRLTTLTNPGVAVALDQTTAASSTFNGRTLGMVYSVGANAVGAAGASDWSNAVTQMAL